MNIRIRLILTKVIVISSMVLALASVGTSQKDWGEIYPFYHWKLFSQPLGTKNIHTEYRVYLKTTTDTLYRRQTLVSTPAFNREEYTYTLDYLIGEAIKDSLQNEKAKNNLLIFLKHNHPQASRFKIVSESFNPMELLKDPGAYTSSTILTLTDAR
ncbi:MAG: hypothetical protein K2X86_00265 [Cytophagaceae bacterium]|nr:hypothetical protein [Cytophagaceae bacterium]